jgi:hypothetical protein
VRFELDGKQIAVAHRDDELWAATAPVANAAPGRHTLVALANGGASARRIVRTCKK